MDIYQVKLYTPEYQDDAFTLLFFAAGASILWLMIGTGRLTRENMAPVLFIALAGADRQRARAQNDVCDRA